MPTSEILVVAGDPSGDLHGSRLIAAFKKEDPSLSVAAIGGALMRERADEFLADLAGRGVQGFLEPLFKLPFLWRLGLQVRDFLSRRKPRALVVIDYYGFNRRILPFAKAAGIPAFYYVSPQVWASRPGRVQVLKRFVKKMLVIFPFERDLYQKAGVPVEFVGNPLLDLMPQPALKDGLTPPVKVGILPGSRPSELRRHLPLFLSAFALFKRRVPRSEALVFAARSLPDEAFGPAREAGAEIVREDDYRRRSQLDLAFCSSGTATLENALLGVPMVVVYKLSWPTYWIARALIRVPHIAMANLLAGKKLVPELVQRGATPEGIAEEAVRLLENPVRYAALRKELASLRGALGSPGAAARAARAILSESVK